MAYMIIARITWHFIPRINIVVALIVSVQISRSILVHVATRSVDHIERHTYTTNHPIPPPTSVERQTQHIESGKRSEVREQIESQQTEMLPSTGDFCMLARIIFVHFLLSCSSYLPRF